MKHFLSHTATRISDAREQRAKSKGHRASTLYSLLSTLCVLLLCSACSQMHESQDNCVVHYKLRFRYDYNMKYADAFPHEVKSVRVYAFDDQGHCKWATVESGDALAAEGYAIDMPLMPGKYHIMAWCGADNNPGNEHFTIARKYQNVDALAHATCDLDTKYSDADQLTYHDEDLHPLFHGSIDCDLPKLLDTGIGDYTVTMPLIKDTNQIRVVLQHLNGTDVNVDDFDFRITADNGSMLSDNSLVEAQQIHYLPWGKFSGTAGVEINDSRDGSRAITQVSVARVDLTTPRFTTEQKHTMMLHITRNSDGQTVARIPVIDYALLVRDLDASGHPIHSDQEYLDRQDQYSMVFFLDERDLWVSSQVIINSWRIVFQDVEL